MVLVGIVGKPSSGKTTYLNATCLTDAKTASYPFTTVKPNHGVTYVRVDCVCKEIGVEDNPQNSICINGIRLIPIEVLDVAGLVPDAWQGKGLGNKFLDDLRTADVLIHVVDASGSLNAEGEQIDLGAWDPLVDVEFLEREIAMWLVEIIKRDWMRISRRAETERVPLAELLSEKFSGLKITQSHLATALVNSGLDPNLPTKWSQDDLISFVHHIREVAKPIVLAANKIDIPVANQKFKQMQEKLGPENLIAVSAFGELILRKLGEEEIIRYIPGDNDFETLKEEKIQDQYKKALQTIKENVLEVFGSTGTQVTLNKVIFDILDMIVVYPVADTSKFADHDGNVLPDAYLVPRGSTARDLAQTVHEDLAKTFIHALNAKTNRRLAEDYELQNGDIIKIVAAGGR